MTEVPHLFVRVGLEVDGVSGVGLASEGLPPKWFTKDPGTTFEEDLPAMWEVIGQAARIGVEEGGRPREFFPWWLALDGRQRAWGADRGHPGLLTTLGSSLIERAVLDGLCRITGMPLHRMVASNRLGIRLGAVHGGLEGTEPRDWLPAVPSSRIRVRHTLGLADALTDAEIPAGDRVDDGLPQDLESSIGVYGLRAFKLKLFGDPARDVARLRAVQAVLRQAIPADEGILVTLDGNENFGEFGAFRTFWESLAGDASLAWLLDRIVCVEQPVHRRHALEDAAGEVLRSWADRPPLIIDESDGAPGDLTRALALGYAGASHKNCKGVMKGIAHACLLARRRAGGEAGLLTGEDLCNLGPVALLQDLAVMALLGVPHVERNGHHYFRGLSPWPAEWQELLAREHADAYCRDGSGLVRVQIRSGELAVGTLNDAPFGLRPMPDPEAAGLDRAPVWPTGGWDA